MKNILTILLIIAGQQLTAQIVKVDFSKAISYNHKLMGRAAALVNEQDTTVTPASCGLWWNQPTDSIWCFNGYNAPNVVDAPNQPWPASITFDLRTRYVIKKICLYIENYSGDSVNAMHSNTLYITSGKPYVWEDTLVRFKKDGIETYNKWKMVTISLPDTNRYIHFEVDKYFGIIREMVVYGQLIDTVAKPAPALVKKPNTYHRFGTNSAFGDGKGKDYQSGQPVDYSLKFDRMRIFGAMRYYVDSSDNLQNNGQGLNILEAIYADTFYNHGVDYFYTMAGLTALSQVDPANSSSGFLTDRKAIDYSLCAGSKVIAGIPVCDNVARFPSSYDHIAWIVKKLAAEFGGRPKPMKILELGNEFDGRFLGAGMYLPDELAAMCSAIYDGHQNTITYNGESVGVRNCGNGILMSMPGLANMSPQYLEAMSFWFDHNRTDHKFASDIINTHAYATTVGFQGTGINGKGLPPESPLYKLQEKMKYIKNFRDSLAPHALVANTETGYDAFEERVSDTTQPYCGTSLYGSSFVNVPVINGQTIELTHGNFIARDLLIHAATDVDFTCQFWLADRIIEGSGCGTFYASGMLALDTIISYVPYYRKRPAYYYFRTVDTLLKGMEFVNEKLVVTGSDSIRIQKYRSVNNNKILYALWSPTAKNAIINNYNFHMDDPGLSSVIDLNTISEIGSVINTNNLQNILLTVTEKPIFVQVDSLLVNLSPTANAGTDQAIALPIATASLNGSGTDPDGTIVSYQWTKISGPASLLSNATSALATVTGLLQGVYLYELKVTDNNGATDTDTMQITVNLAVNIPPVANAGPDKTITLPTNNVALNGSGTDVDGTIVSYQWTKVSGPTPGNLNNATSVNASATGLAAGIYKFELTVIDNNGATNRDTMQVIVNNAPASNQPPVAKAGPDQSITLPTNTVQLNGLGTDADGTITAYLWTKITGPAAGTLLNATSANATATGLEQGTYKFELMVTDNNGVTGKDTMQVTVNAAVQTPNQAPVVNAGTGITVNMPANTAILNGSATDADGTIASYIWTKVSGPSAGTISNANAVVTNITGLIQGIYKYELKAIDNLGAIGKDTVQVTVNAAPVPNQPPTANAGADISITLPLNSTLLSGNGTDADGTIVGYNWKLLSGPSQYLLQNATNAQALLSNLNQGIYQVELMVTDNAGATGKDTVIITVANARLVPIVSNDVKVMPNPVQTTLKVEVSTTTNRIFSLKLFDGRGAVLYKKDIAPNMNVHSEMIDMSRYAAGMYFIEVRFDDRNKVTKRIVKVN